MKQLLLMRHAKSDWEAGLADFERPLNKRGNKAAAFMGKFCLENQLIPDLIYASPANRAKTTTKLFANACNYDSKIEFCEAFYFGYLSELHQKLQSTSDDINRLLMLGHNPTWSDLVHYFSGIYTGMPTAAIAVLELNVNSWADVKQNTCKLVKFLKPRDLM